MESGDAIQRGALPRFPDAIRAGNTKRPGARPADQPARSLSLRLPGDSGRGLLCRPGHGQRSAPANLAVRFDELAASDPPARGAATTLPGGEIRLQKSQARRFDPFPGRTPPRLLGRARLRLVCGALKKESV